MMKLLCGVNKDFLLMSTSVSPSTISRDILDEIYLVRIMFIIGVTLGVITFCVIFAYIITYLVKCVMRHRAMQRYRLDGYMSLEQIT